MTTTVIPLGTAGALPTRDRHLPAVAVERAGVSVLFDCGEGTQRRLLAAGLKPPRLRAVCITHLHGDHVFGLPGLLSTLGLLDRSEPLVVAGPEGIARLVRGLPGLGEGELPYPIRFVELPDAFDAAVVLEADAYRIVARPLAHRVPAVGYRFEEKPRPGHLDVEWARALGVTDYRHYRALKAGEAVTLPDGRVVPPEAVVGPPRPGVSFAYVTDTMPCEGGIALARAATLLYHEATFLHDLQELALARGHSTAREAAEVARAAGARRLLLGHFSARYRTPDALVAEARQVFQNTEAAVELKRYDLEKVEG
ncbi:ribonuclease Z [Rhodothermaceae bacterium RA]|nr:ribonuclease Z [Rhodothermaceae bacterium RA]